MATKRRIKKRRIKEDQLVTYAVKASQFAQEYFTHIVIGVVVLVVAVAVVVFVTNTRRNAGHESQRELAGAMTQYNSGDNEAAAVSFAQIADRYGGHPAGRVALYFLGKSQLALSRYDEALQSFQEYLKKAGSDDEFRVAANLGMANAYQGMENFAAAAELLERLSQSMDPDDPRYVNVLFQTARDFEESGSREKAIEYYGLVDEKATGSLKERASVRLALLK
ncbi:MAG: tetratricopeptide repeat protein [bacterium]